MFKIKYLYNTRLLRQTRRTALRLLLAALLLSGLHALAFDAGVLQLAPALSVEIDGAKINYTSNVKSQQALTLVLIHGFGASIESWFDVHPALAAKWQVVRLDLLGHGFTDKPESGDYSPQGYARLATRFIEKLGLKRVVLVGHSMGGAIALLITMAPSKSFDIAGLVLIASSGYPQKPPFFIEDLRDPFKRFVSTLIPAEQRTRYVLERIFFVKSRLTPERVQRYAHFAALPGSHHAATQTALLIQPPNIEQLSAQIKQINVPTLIVWGDQDRVVPLDNAYRFNKDIKNSTLRILPQTGHMSPEERPKQVIEAILTFASTL